MIQSKKRTAGVVAWAVVLTVNAVTRSRWLLLWPSFLVVRSGCFFRLERQLGLDSNEVRSRLLGWSQDDSL